MMNKKYHLDRVPLFDRVPLSEYNNTIISREVF
jgi:hypothetical protein